MFVSNWGRGGRWRARLEYDGSRLVGSSACRFASQLSRGDKISYVLDEGAAVAGSADESALFSEVCDACLPIASTSHSRALSLSPLSALVPLSGLVPIPYRVCTPACSR